MSDSGSVKTTMRAMAHANFDASSADKKPRMSDMVFEHTVYVRTHTDEIYRYTGFAIIGSDRIDADKTVLEQNGCTVISKRGGYDPVNKIDLHKFSYTELIVLPNGEIVKDIQVREVNKGGIEKTDLGYMNPSIDRMFGPSPSLLSDDRRLPKDDLPRIAGCGGSVTQAELDDLYNQAKYNIDNLNSTRSSIPAIDGDRPLPGDIFNFKYAGFSYIKSPQVLNHEHFRNDAGLLKQNLQISDLILKIEGGLEDPNAAKTGIWTESYYSEIDFRVKSEAPRPYLILSQTVPGKDVAAESSIAESSIFPIDHDKDGKSDKFGMKIIPMAAKTQQKIWIVPVRGGMKTSAETGQNNDSNPQAGTTAQTKLMFTMLEKPQIAEVDGESAIEQDDKDRPPPLGMKIKIGDLDRKKKKKEKDPRLPDMGSQRSRAKTRPATEKGRVPEHSKGKLTAKARKKERTTAEENKKIRREKKALANIAAKLKKNDNKRGKERAADRKIGLRPGREKEKEGKRGRAGKKIVAEQSDLSFFGASPFQSIGKKRAKKENKPESKRTETLDRKYRMLWLLEKSGKKVKNSKKQRYSR